MTKFEEEVKRPANGPITELNNNMQEVFGQYRKMRQYADYLEYNSKKKDEEFQELLDKYSNLNDNYEKEVIKSSKLESQIIGLKSQLQQQALPVVPEDVAKLPPFDDMKEYVLDERLLTIREYLNKLDGKSNSDITEAEAWCMIHEDIVYSAMLNGYTVEKPQLFYLKNKLTTSYLALDINTGYYEHWGEEIIPKLLKKQGYKISFTQAEIESMQTGSYEQIKVEEEK